MNGYREKDGRIQGEERKDTEKIVFKDKGKRLEGTRKRDGRNRVRRMEG